MFWAFVGGAADSINQDLKARKASEEEQRIYKERMEMQQKIMEAAEEAKRKNRVINQVEDLNSGKLIETTASGQRTEMALPQEYVQQQKAAIGLAAEKERLDAERAQREFDAKIKKDEAAALASQSRAESDKIRAGRTSTLMEYDRARTEKARRADTPEGEKPPSLTEKRQAAAAATKVSDEIVGRAAAIEDAAIKAEIAAARTEALAETDVIKRLQMLQEVAALVASMSQSPYSPNNASTY